MLVWMGLYWEGGICEYGLDREMIVNPRTEATDWNSLFKEFFSARRFCGIVGVQIGRGGR